MYTPNDIDWDNIDSPENQTKLAAVRARAKNTLRANNAQNLFASRNNKYARNSAREACDSIN